MAPLGPRRLATFLAASATAAGLFVAALLTARPFDSSRAAKLARGAHELLLPTDADLESEHRGPPVAWAEALPPITVVDNFSGSEATVRLYRRDGSVNADVLETFAKMTSHGQEPHPISPRTLQLAFKAAYHFRATKLVVVSAFRPPKEGKKNGKHATGDAIDFRLPGVKASRLAAYLRTFPRAGVGVYTHPRTQFVHLDVREQSFHWLDASPPGRTWREKRLRDPTQVARDASYAPERDLPEPYEPLTPPFRRALR